ncbi:MAG TPA: orotate phosphoribosyltransferase [Candidatus Binatia bacterium]|nr:orotate phosphoribosyltransferase [Candidatus Binatia bacterium]
MSADRPDPRRAELRALLAERAFRWGDFVLASGRRSNYYFDGKQITLEGGGLALAASLMLERCRELGVTAVAGDDGVGPLLGAIAALSAADRGPALRAFMIRKADKQHGTAAKVAGPAPLPAERTALVDDVVTTGGSVFRALEALEPTGVTVVEALVIVDREEGGEAALREHGLALHALFRRSAFSAPQQVDGPA